MATPSKRGIYAAIAAAGILTPILVAHLWGGTWPHAGYQLHIRESAYSELRCEALSTLPGQVRIITPRAGYKGCLYSGIGNKKADGTLQLRARPVNPLNVQAWLNWGQSFANIRPEQLDGYCTNEEFLSDAPVSKECDRYREVLKEHFHVPPQPL